MSVGIETLKKITVYSRTRLQNIDRFIIEDKRKLKGEETCTSSKKPSTSANSNEHEKLLKFGFYKHWNERWN